MPYFEDDFTLIPLSIPSFMSSREFPTCLQKQHITQVKKNKTFADIREAHKGFSLIFVVLVKW